MKKDDDKLSLSRRRFIKNTGSYAIGSAVLANIPPTEALAEETTDSTVPGSHLLDLTVNGTSRRIMITPSATLLSVIRNNLGLTGTKMSCNRGTCGSCTVLIDGKPVYSCHMLALDAAGKKVTTIEGLMNGEELHPIQQAFVDHDGLQCGFCTPGQIMSAKGLLNRNPNASSDQILTGMSGNLCRCAAYPNILKSVAAAAK